ncbi:hypothetical protein K474DRAFT_1700413 [Panus rudis PR-1116 ss-1]|nr:hypothetical protein K474DRAFT_1700413 [Panus rudis PR-1116 ss-1]
MCCTMRALRRYTCGHIFEFQQIPMTCRVPTCALGKGHQANHDCAKRGCITQIGRDRAVVLEKPEEKCSKCQREQYGASENAQWMAREVEFAGDIPAEELGR